MHRLFFKSHTKLQLSSLPGPTQPVGFLPPSRRLSSPSSLLFSLVQHAIQPSLLIPATCASAACLQFAPDMCWTLAWRVEELLGAMRGLRIAIASDARAMCASCAFLASREVSEAVCVREEGIAAKKREVAIRGRGGVERVPGPNMCRRSIYREEACEGRSGKTAMSIPAVLTTLLQLLGSTQEACHACLERDLLVGDHPYKKHPRPDER